MLQFWIDTVGLMSLMYLLFFFFWNLIWKFLNFDADGRFLHLHWRPPIQQVALEPLDVGTIYHRY